MAPDDNEDRPSVPPKKTHPRWGGWGVVCGGCVCSTTSPRPRPARLRPHRRRRHQRDPAGNATAGVQSNAPPRPRWRRPIAVPNVTLGPHPGARRNSPGPKCGTGGRTIGPRYGTSIEPTPGDNGYTACYRLQ